MSTAEHSTSVPTWDAIPKELRDLSRWFVWDLVPRADGKMGKPPRSAKTGSRLGWNHPDAGVTFADAMAFAQAEGHERVGIVVQADDGFVSVDVDDGLDDRGTVLPWADDIVQRLGPGFYCEVSPSGRGLRLVGTGRLPGPGTTKVITNADGVRLGQVEIYDRRHFVTITGKNAGRTVPYFDLGQTDRINATWSNLGLRRDGDDDHGAGWGSGAWDEETWSTGLSDDRVLGYLRRSADAAALFDQGDLGKYAGDHSRADSGLVGYLSFYCGSNPDQIDRLFRRSRLFREKWDEDRGGSTYGERTIGFVLRGRSQDDYFGRRSQAKAEPSPSQGDRPRFVFRSARELDEEPTSPWAVEGVFRENALAAIVGPWGAYKSFLVAALLYALSTDVPDWYGHRVRARGTTALIAAEGRGGLSKRIRALANHFGHDDLPDRLLILGEAPALQDDVDAVIAALADVDDLRIVAIDTVARTNSGDENSATDMGAYVRAADRIREATGAAVVLVHHDGLNGKIRGSSALAGALDVMVKVKREKGGIVVTCEKAKDDPAFAPFHLVPRTVPAGFVDQGSDDPDADFWDREMSITVATSLVMEIAPEISITDRPNPLGLGRSALQALAVLVSDAPDGTTFTDWHERTGLPKSSFQRSKNDLVEGGVVERRKVVKRDVYIPTETGVRAVDGTSQGEADDDAA